MPPLNLQEQPGDPGSGLAATNDERSPGRALLGRVATAVAPSLIVAAVIATRFPTPLLRAEFWAEDATEFFFDAISMGPRSIFTPVYGYHFLLERLIALAATGLPVVAAPFVYAWGALLVGAYCLSYLARDGFSWIAAQRWQRLLIACLLAAGPGTADILLNLANLPSLLAFLGLLLLLERPHRLGPWKVVVLFLILASSGQALILLPAVAWLGWTTRRPSYWAVGAVALVFGLLNATGSHQASTSAGLLDWGVVLRLPVILVENAFLRLIPAPFLGNEATRALMISPWPIFWGAALAGMAGFGVLAFREMRRDRDGTVLLLLAYAGAIGLLGLVAISRSQGALLSRETGSLLRLIRYSFLPSATATLLWSSWLLRRSGAAWPIRALESAAFVLVAVNLAACYPLRFARPDLFWPERSLQVAWLLEENRRTGRPVEITLEMLSVHPVGWKPANGRVSVTVPGR